MIPNRISSEVGGWIPDEFLEEILEKLVSVFINRIETSCGGDKPQRYVTLRATPRLAEMQKLGLVENEPIHKPGCGCAPTEQASIPYGLTKKAWQWYASYTAENRNK